MDQLPSSLPKPDKNTVKAWLSRLTLNYVHTTGWKEVNQRLSAITFAGRLFITRQFPETNDAIRRQDFLDGVAFGLLAVTHATDVADLHALFLEPTIETDAVNNVFSDEKTALSSDAPGAGASAN